MAIFVISVVAGAIIVGGEWGEDVAVAVVVVIAVIAVVVVIVAVAVIVGGRGGRRGVGASRRSLLSTPLP